MGAESSSRSFYYLESSFKKSRTFNLRSPDLVECLSRLLIASFAFSFICSWSFPSRLWKFHPLREKWPTVSGKGQCHGDEHGRSSCRSLDRVLRCRLEKSAWRGARVVESTCLESMRPSNGTVGSNPTLSATPRRGKSKKLKGKSFGPTDSLLFPFYFSH